MFDKYMFALGRGVRSAMNALDDKPEPADPSCACRAESTEIACEADELRGATLVSSDLQASLHAKLWVLLA